MPNWEDKWDDFSKKDVRDQISQDENLENACQQIIDYVKAHEEEIRSQIKADESSGEYPHDTIQSWDLDTTIEGHEVGWSAKSYMDRDGGNEDSETELYVDGQQVSGFYGQYATRKIKKGWELDDLLCNLVGQ